MDNSGYLVVIEWDGMKPPTPFYHRVRSLTSGVRQNDSATMRKVAPFARRSERNENAVIMQEGAIYCASKSLARALALLAQEYGAVNVDIATVSKMSPVEATTADLAALSKINKILGRRGRPPNRSNRWISVTCYEEVLTQTLLTDKDIINCPTCGSLSVSMSFPGEDVESCIWETGYDESLFEQWLAHRLVEDGIVTFHEISYIIDDDPPMDDFVRAPFANSSPDTNPTMYATLSLIAGTATYTSLLPTPQKKIIGMMARSDLDALDVFYAHPEILVRILDAIFVGRLKLDEEERLEGRLTALSSMMVRYPDIASDYLLALDDDKVDFFDASPIIPIKDMVDYFTAMYAYQKKQQTVPA